MADDEVVIKITVDDSELEDYKTKKQEVGEKEDFIPDIGGESVTSGEGDTILDEAKYHGLFGLASGGVGGASKGLGMAGGLASNPMGALQGIAGGIAKNLGFVKHFAKAIPYVGLVIMAIEIIPLVVKGVLDMLTKAGSPFDKRFKRILANERNAFFNREEQRKRQLGLSPVIITSAQGFSNLGGMATTYTLKQVRDAGISQIGLRDKAGGVTY